MVLSAHSSTFEVFHRADIAIKGSVGEQVDEFRFIFWLHDVLLMG
jgi:hypothetical protein